MPRKLSKRTSLASILSPQNIRARQFSQRRRYQTQSLTHLHSAAYSLLRSSRLRVSSRASRLSRKSYSSLTFAAAQKDSSSFARSTRPSRTLYPRIRFRDRTPQTTNSEANKYMSHQYLFRSFESYLCSLSSSRTESSRAKPSLTRSSFYFSRRSPSCLCFGCSNESSLSTRSYSSKSSCHPNSSSPAAILLFSSPPRLSLSLVTALASPRLPSSPRRSVSRRRVSLCW